MTIQDVIDCLQDLAPLNYAEDFDNVGLLVGDNNKNVTGILVTLDTIEAVIDEAIENSCNLIVSFHPIIFKGLKKLTGKTYVERVAIKAIQNDIAIFSIHTALDNAYMGVNAIICDKLNLKNKKILLPQPGVIKKLQTYVPKEHAIALRTALFDAGAGSLGNYESCSFNVEGKGTYMGNQNSNPSHGQKGQLHTENEIAVSVVFKKHLQSKVLKALFETHPYEEVAYEIMVLDNTDAYTGMGMIGELNDPMDEKECLNWIKSTFNSGCIKHSKLRSKPIKKIAVLGGSGSFAIDAAKTNGADLFVTADLKYHDFFTAENDIVLADIGHSESEQFTKSFLVDYLSKKITSFAIILSKTNTNPVKYL
ncbi:Nif3-like dinuclear metal center hexameric protein [Winogradskyella alexanderae]|uniref:GTP cyclohydrolase 1 type 2 homolog n=1 Tax=Winogradskyella alexanderae TaxID=2877123 RepID=A0ABS7XW06_9FLAO|nr:Nif3-like dinuclear metal center hexameric protein [Winogradskyella alexanderae]MCA0133016.1 Nif3-like dinuclear metal center hexameric protein [Winogradskyella alexanderae]